MEKYRITINFEKNVMKESGEQLIIVPSIRGKPMKTVKTILFSFCFLSRQSCMPQPETASASSIIFKWKALYGSDMKTFFGFDSLAHGAVR